MRGDGSVPREDAGRDAGPDAARDAATRMDGAVDGGRDAEVDAADIAVPGDMPPELTTVGYFNDVLGARILIAGSDPNGDIESYTALFFKGETPVTVDLNSDQTVSPDEDKFTGTITPTQDRKSFFIRLDVSRDFIEQVDNVRVTVKDSGGRESEPSMAMLRAAPTVGGTCDPRGFNLCSNNGICAQVSGGRYSCQTLATARTAACNAAPQLNPMPGVPSTVSSALSSVSLWDVPTSCTSGDMEFPDRVVKLKLDATASVTLSTDNANTGFDTVIYKLDECKQPVPQACVDSPCGFCEDDVMAGSNLKTNLTLNDLAAGEYYIVVDSKPPTPTDAPFEITATIN